MPTPHGRGVVLVTPHAELRSVDVSDDVFDRCADSSGNAVSATGKQQVKAVEALSFLNLDVGDPLIFDDTRPL